MVYLKSSKEGNKKNNGSVLKMTKKEMKLKLATEIQELKELEWEYIEEIEKAEIESDERSVKRYKRWRSQVAARISQTKIIGEMFGIKPMDLENMAFNMSVEKATENLKQA